MNDLTESARIVARWITCQYGKDPEYQSIEDACLAFAEGAGLSASEAEELTGRADQLIHDMGDVA